MAFKLNLKMFKSKPVFWIVGGIVLFVVFYMVASKGAGSAASSSTVAGSSAPTDAQVAAASAAQIATIQANSGIAQANATLQAQQSENATNIAIATLAAQVQNNQTQASSDVSQLDITSQTALQSKGLDVQQQIADMNGQYALDTARTASQTQLGLADIQAKMFQAQLNSVVQQTAYSSAASIGGDSGVRAYEAALVTLNNPNGNPVYNNSGNFSTAGMPQAGQNGGGGAVGALI